MLLSSLDLVGITVVGLVFVAWGIFRVGREEDPDGGPLRLAMAATVAFAAVLIGALYIRA
jgi:hypothetical protein